MRLCDCFIFYIIFSYFLFLFVYSILHCIFQYINVSVFLCCASPQVSLFSLSLVFFLLFIFFILVFPPFVYNIHLFFSGKKNHVPGIYFSFLSLYMFMTPYSGGEAIGTPLLRPCPSGRILLRLHSGQEASAQRLAHASTSRRHAQVRLICSLLRF